jgi:hypothetical protein
LDTWVAIGCKGGRAGLEEALFVAWLIASVLEYCVSQENHAVGAAISAAMRSQDVEE